MSRRRRRTRAATLLGFLAGGLLVSSGWSEEPAGEPPAPRVLVRFSWAEVVAGRADGEGGGPAGDLGDGGPAIAARLARPGGVLADPDGNVYVSDTLHHRVRVIDAATGRIRTLAGTGTPGYNGDDIPALQAQLSDPGELEIDGWGRIYVSDSSNHRVRRIDPESGLISTVAGNGSAGEDGDGGMAVAAPLRNPHALFLEQRSLIIASAVSSTLRQMDLVTGRIFTLRVRRPETELPVFFGLARWRDHLVLASPRPGSIDGIQDDDKLVRLLGAPDVDVPQDVAVSPAGDLYICETGRNRVVRWDGERLEVVVENLGRPRSLAFDPDGNLLIADTLYNRVLRVRLGVQPGWQVAAAPEGGPCGSAPG